MVVETVAGPVGEFTIREHSTTGQLVMEWGRWRLRGVEEP
jgi:hypothetical protein